MDARDKLHFVSDLPRAKTGPGSFYGGRIARCEVSLENQWHREGTRGRWQPVEATLPVHLNVQNITKG